MGAEAAAEASSPEIKGAGAPLTKYRLLRAALQFRYWRRERPLVGGAVWVGAWCAFLIATGLLVGATQMSAGVVGLAYGLFWRSQYGAHRRELRAHFVAPKLKAGF